MRCEGYGNGSWCAHPRLISNIKWVGRKLPTHVWGPTMIKSVIYTLGRLYGIHVQIGKYIIGTIDYSTGARPAQTEEKYKVKAIKLPESMQRSFLKQAKVSFETYDATYIIKCSVVPFVVQSNNFILDNGKRYNIKNVEIIQDTCYLIGADSDLGETNE